MKNGLVNVQSFPCVQNEKVKVNVQEVLVTEKKENCLLNVQRFWRVHNRKRFGECSKGFGECTIGKGLVNVQRILRSAR